MLSLFIVLLTQQNRHCWFLPELLSLMKCQAAINFFWSIFAFSNKFLIVAFETSAVRLLQPILNPNKYLFYPKSWLQMLAFWLFGRLNWILLVSWHITVFEKRFSSRAKTAKFSVQILYLHNFCSRGKILEIQYVDTIHSQIFMLNSQKRYFTYSCYILYNRNFNSSVPFHHLLIWKHNYI